MKSFWKSLSAVDLLAISIIFYAFVLLPTVLIQAPFEMQAQLSSAEKISPKPGIVAGSTLIDDIAQDVAGDKLEVHNLIPPGMCPGHYDVKPSDVETLANSKAIIIHNWQQDKANITGLIEAANNPNLIVKVIDVKDDPMVPETEAETIDKIAQALSDIDPENSAYYRGRADRRAQSVLAEGEKIENRLQEVEVTK